MRGSPVGARRYTLIASLYVSQAIPLGFFVVAMPGILRSYGVGLEQVGLVGALAFPWLIKFLWAPLVDGVGSRRAGHYRSWILPLQTLSVLAVSALSLADLRQGLAALFFIGAAFMLCSATQDIATDGLAVRVFGSHERGPANGIQVGGYYLGQILGGGAVLVLFHRLGWTPAVLAMAGFLALPLIPALRFREPAAPDRAAPPAPAPAAAPAPAQPGGAQAARRVDFGALWRFLRRDGAGLWIGILLLYRAGDAMALTMVNPMLVDQGLSLEQIGLLLGLAGSAAALVGALAGGLLMERLGRNPALVVFGLAQAGVLCLYALPAGGLAPFGAIYPLVLASALVGGMGTAALYTHMMDRSDPRTAGTDFTLQQSLCAAGPLVGSAVSGFSAAALGYAAHFALCGGLTLAAAGLVAASLTSRHGAPTRAPLPDAG